VAVSTSTTIDVSKLDARVELVVFVFGCNVNSVVEDVPTEAGALSSIPNKYKIQAHRKEVNFNGTANGPHLLALSHSDPEPSKSRTLYSK